MYKEDIKMVNIMNTNVYKEVLNVISSLVKEDYDKISKDYIDFLKSNCNNEYESKYDVSKPFEEQELLEGTKYILFYLFEKFGATDSQKIKIRSIKADYEKKLEENKQKDNTYEIFKNRQNDLNKKILNNSKENIEIVEYKREKWYKGLFSKILKIFRLN